MRAINILLLFLSLFFFAGCVDDEFEKSTPQPTIDEYEGSHNLVQFTKETKDFIYGDLVFHIKTPDGTIIQREAKHNRLSGISRFLMDKGLKEGKYQLLSMEYTVTADCPEINGTKRCFGLGCFIQVGVDGINVNDTYNEQIGLWGNGDKENPYRISSPDHLEKIRFAIQSGNGKYVTSSTCFEQQGPIDMSGYNDLCGWEGNWYQIGTTPTYPFTGYYNGNGYPISNLKMFDADAVGASLFGYVNKALITNVVIENANIRGYCGVSAIAGMIVSSGQGDDATCIRGCSVRSSMVKGRSDGIGVGAVVGITDPNVQLWIDSCEVYGSSSLITGAFGVGGILGGATALSMTQITNCHNRGTDVEAIYNNAGGIVGYADTLYVYSCSNEAKIYGSTGRETLSGLPAGSVVNVGTGGIAGGSGASMFFGNTNNGKIEGSRGVGGIIGSTMVNTNPETYYNDTFIGYCCNTGEVKGASSVGGLCGEAQLSCYKSYNKGKVNATSMYAGGILGCASIASINNTANFASVSAPTICGGLAGQIIIGAIALNTNLGSVSSSGDYVGGMIGRAGSTLAMNYCANFSEIKGGAYTGGLIGEVGSIRELTSKDKFGLVLATAEAAISIGSTIGGQLLGAVPAIFKFSKAAKDAFDLVLNVVSLSLDAVLYLYDVNSSLNNTIRFAMNFFGSTTTDLITASLKGIISNNISIISMDMDNLLESNLPTTIFSNLASGLKGIETAKEFLKQRATIAAWNEKETNMQIFSNSMNYKINQRHKAEIRIEKAAKITHSLINGVCLVASFATISASLVGSIVGTPATGAVIIAIFGTATTVVSFINSVTSITGQFDKNAIVITQCINFGKINSSNGHNVGGLIGALGDGGLISDCLNGASSTIGGAIAGELGKKISLTRCLNIGASWERYTSVNNGVHANYCLNGTTKVKYPVTKHDDGTVTTYVYYRNLNSLSKTSTYQGWDFKKLWRIPFSETGAFPIPNMSEMQEEHPKQ